MRISVSESDFISKGVECDIRADGRSRRYIRPFSINLDFISQANGSARCIAGSDVLVCVKAEVASVMDSQEMEEERDATLGKVVCNVQWSVSLPISFQII